MAVVYQLFRTCMGEQKVFIGVIIMEVVTSLGLKEDIFHTKIRNLVTLTLFVEVNLTEDMESGVTTSIG